MQLRPDAMPNKVSHHAEPVRFHVLLDRRPNVSDRVADLRLLDALVQRGLGHLEQLPQFRGQLLAHRHRDRSVSVIPVKHNSAVDGNDISRFQRPLFRWDPVHDLFIDRSAQHTWITVISLERRRSPEFRNQFLGGLLQALLRTPAATTPFKWFRTWRTILPLRLIFSISSGDLRMIRSSPKLIIDSNFSDSNFVYSSFVVPLLASCLAMTVDHAENLRRNIFHRPICIDRHQLSLRPVVIRYPPGLRLIGSQSTRNDFFTIVVADHQLGSVHITQLVDERWLKADVIEPSTGGTRTPPGKPQQ